MNKGSNTHDPRGLIFESFRIEDVTPEECRSIFLDWALGQPLGANIQNAIRSLFESYQDENPDHPMTAVLVNGLETAKQPKRRGGRAGRSR